MDNHHPILEIKNLKTEFQTIDGIVSAVNGVDLTLYRGEIVGLVGESGSGKSVTALSILRLLAEPPARISGSICLYQKRRRDPIDIVRLSPGSQTIQAIRGNEIAMVFQEPMRALSPVFTVGHQVAEAIWLHRDIKKREAFRETINLFNQVGIPNPARQISAYPHQLSGGQRQRVMIAMALACRPSILIADEPTTALDVTIQAQILELLKDLQTKLNLTVLLITHDLGIVAKVCSRVNVMYMGKIVEQTDVFNIFERPAHPYTQGLLKSLPMPGQGYKERLPAIRGNVPDPQNLQPGCSFGPRCNLFEDGLCNAKEEVDLISVDKNHDVRCYKTEFSQKNKKA